MAILDDGDTQRQIVGVTGRYVLGGDTARAGINVFACRLKSISADSFVAAAPVTGLVGDAVTAHFEPFGALHGRVQRYVGDGFAVEIDAGPAMREALRQRIAQFGGRLWSGDAEKRGMPRYMPAEPRSVILLETGQVLPCLVIDYSASGAAVSAAITPPSGSRVTVGQVDGTVVRGFDVGFAVRFEALQDPDEVEQFLEAPAEWRRAVRVVSHRVDTDEGEDHALTGASY
jgi:hypothetical protein